MATGQTQAGIVTTLRAVGPSLQSFIAWHLASGFSHLFLFFDDPADPQLAEAAVHPAITAIPHDAALRQAWKRLPEYLHYADFIANEVMARQVLNAALALELARARGLSWLLHIDADELFHTPDGSVAAHFHWAEAQNANAITYPNYEAVPEAIDIRDPFRQVDLFKIPPAFSPGPVTQAGFALLAATPQLQPGRFHFYSNGKSAVRLAAQDMRPRGVHLFDDPAAPGAPLESRDAFILHYACCGFDSFWQKYRLLGGFGDKWFGRTDIRAGSPLHLESRDVVATGDRELALDFYRRRIAIEDAVCSEALIRENVLARLCGPRQMLEELLPGGILG